MLLTSASAAEAGLADEAAGIDGIVAVLISVYDQVVVVALGEAHGGALKSHERFVYRDASAW
jgi:hypothetical protein